MADQFYDDIPVSTNTIAADLVQMEASLGYIKDVFQAFVNSWSDTTATNIKPNIIGDADNNTLIQCEESADENIIRFDIAGTEQMTLQDGKLEPTTDNDVDLGSSSKEFKDGYFDGTVYADVVDVNGTAINQVSLRGIDNRSTFRWKDGDELYIGAGSYYHSGTSNQILYWDSELTFQLEKIVNGGTNDDSDNFGADGWHYIYLDDSAIVTKGTTSLDNTCFINVLANGAPVWNATKKGWYGDGVGSAATGDRCIFAVYETGGAILEFFNNGDYVVFADHIGSYGPTDPGTDWAAEVTLSIPSFARQAMATFQNIYVDGTGSTFWRTEGQTATTGHRACAVNADSTLSANTLQVIASANLKIDIKQSNADANTTTVYTNGWYFPTGM